jgi:hypothetical protein
LVITNQDNDEIEHLLHDFTPEFSIINQLGLVLVRIWLKIQLSEISVKKEEVTLCLSGRALDLRQIVQQSLLVLGLFDFFRSSLGFSDKISRFFLVSTNGLCSR